MRVTDDQGNEYEISEEVLTGQPDDAAEVRRLIKENAEQKTELERRGVAIDRLAKKTGLTEEPELTPDQEAEAVFAAAKAKGTPNDLAQAEYVRAVTDATMRRQAAKSEAAAVAKKYDAIQAQLDQLRNA